MFKGLREASRSREANHTKIPARMCANRPRSAAYARVIGRIFAAFLAVFFVATGYAASTNAPPRGDAVAPSVTITSPVPGNTVKGTIGVSVSGSDNVGVTRIDLYANNKIVGSTASSIFTFSWDTTTVPDGAATLKAVVYDAAKNRSNYSVNVTVANTATDAQVPSVTIISPTSGSTVKGTLAVSVSASDNIGVTHIDLYANDVLVDGAAASAYTFGWNTSTVADGAATLKAVAYDAAGNHSNFTTNVSVANATTTTDTQAPSVNITSPAAGSTLNGTVVVAVSAADNVGVTRVDLYANEAIVGSTAGPTYNFSWNTSTTPDGPVTLKAVADDAANNLSNFLTNVTVANATTTTTNRTLSVASSNPATGVAIEVYPADTSGLTDGTALLSRTYRPNAKVWLTAALRSGNNYFIKWQKDGVDYDTAATTSLVMDADHTLTAVYQTPSCTGVAVYPGTDNLKNAVAAYPAGTTFCLKAGVHRFTASVVARNYDQYIGEPGAILNGSKVLTSFTRSGSYWVASGQTQQEPALSPINGGYPVCAPTAPGCIYPEKVFVDGRDLWQVTSLAALGTGQFYFDYANDQIYLFDDPTGHVVETTTGSGGIVGYSGGTSDFVTVKNLTFEKFGGGEVVASTNNVLKAVNGWRVENNEFRLISGVAVANYGNGTVRNNNIHHNGQLGIVGSGLVEGNIISYNNTDGFDINSIAGGTKFLRTNGLVVKGNTISGNTGPGLWTDYDNINGTYANNIIEDNAAAGMLNEFNCGAVIKDNVLQRNNAANYGGSLWHGGQIEIRGAKDQQVYGNDISTAGTATNGVDVRGGDASTTGPNCGTILLQNVAVHDNVIRLDTGDLNGVVGGTAGYGATYNIKFTNNTYYLRDLAGAYFWYDAATRNMTKTEWQAAGQDVTGTFLQY